ncbi:MAG: hypothetical protein HKO82_02385 [Acidimicrobiia bacterium]|nr:hypothetical protein [Acidimicrobiia bacterium]MBT8248533.1 hypothetical protein [Acidimicrobiia bacterium]NNF88404.1 hypothetical protein [Acidimicrobiia bacterium]NNJ46428.1 hypothetical protein [Acidimicrobiia bacterium]NNL12520.1 hypothetical protein [Acidimicrobiia bacterium]
MRKILLLLTVFLAACSGGNSDGPALTFADFDNPPTTSEVLGGSSTTSPLPASTTTSSTSTTTSTTLLVIDTPGPVTILTSSDYSVLQGRGAPRRLVDAPVEAGFDDLDGGFLFQMPGAGSDTAADQRIFWSRASNPEAQPYLDVNDGSLLKLWAVEPIDGAPTMILTITDDADDPVQRIERLVVFDFVTGDRVLGEVGSAGSGPTAISYGGGRFILEQLSGSQSRFEFRNDQGAVIDLASNPHKGCSDDPTCPTTPALDPSGSFLAYLQPAADETVDLVVYDVDLGEEIGRIGLPEGAAGASGLDFDASTVIVNPADRDGRAIVVDTERATVGEFGLAGVVQFLRSEPGFDGPIELLTGADAGA